MFKTGKTRKSGSFNEFSQYMEGNDVYNSFIIRELNNPSYNRINYVITRFEYRPDLIAEDIYGSTDYCGLLMSQCRMSVSGYTKGNILRVLSKSDLDRIILNI